MGGISSARFSAAFGSKAGVFRAVLARDLDTHGRVLAPLRDAAWPPRAAIARAALPDTAVTDRLRVWDARAAAA